MVKSLSRVDNMEISKIITKNNHLTTEKSVISYSLNEHFISSGSLFEAQSHNSSTLNSLIVPSTDISCKLITQKFDFNQLSVSEVHKVLSFLDPYKPVGPDKLEPFYLKLAADFIAEPLTYLFNLSISHCEIPKIWKSAFVSPLFKGGGGSFAAEQL